ncbi:MAG: PA2779 family protein [Moraxellaceae bacterium]
MRHSRRTRLVAALLLGSMTLTSLPLSAASLSTHEALTVAEAQDGTARRAVTDLLARADVQAELVRYGVSPDMAARRVADMSDAEVATLHGRLGDTPAGAGVVGAIVFVFVLLLVTDILGLTKVFPFTKPIR